MSKYLYLALSSLALMAMLLSACAGAATPAATQAPEAEATEAPVVEESEPPAEEEAATPIPEEPEEPQPTTAPPSGERIPIRWFVGLGTGGNPEQQEVQNQVVANFNASQDRIELIIEVVDSTTAEQSLQTRIAAGDPPDIVGPVGTRGANAFQGLFLDLEPYIEESGYDLSIYDPSAVEYYRDQFGLTALPFAVYPSVIFYNRDLFDEAGLTYPPHKVGEPYEGKDWDVDALTELAIELTVDANGNAASSPDFDPENIVQFGYAEQWTEFSPRAEWTMFGAGNFIAEDGKTAVIPNHWRAAADWFYSGIWEKHFIPNNAYINSDLLAAGNIFDSGNVAMAHSHLWYTCCNSNVPNWDVAVMPSYNGQITAKLHADTFRILKSTKNPAEAFEVLTYLLNSEDLLGVYGAFPANKNMQEPFIAKLDEKFTQGVDWQVFVDMLGYVDNPSHEANMPNFIQAYEREKALGNLLYTQAGLDLDAELETFLEEMQAIFDQTE